MKQPALSLVFPAFNEADNLPLLLETAVKIGDALGLEFEIVVVDDGSRDRSAEVLDRWCARDERVRAVHHAANQGYGAALRSGLRAATGRLVFFSDADLQFDLAEIQNLLMHAEDFDIVAGYRAPRRDPWLRRGIAWVWGVLVQTLFDLRVRDIDCAFKIFRREVLDAIPIDSIGAFVNTEILARARAAAPAAPVTESGNPELSAMRLLLVGAFPYPHHQGSQIYFREQARALRNAGAEVELLTYASGLGPMEADSESDGFLHHTPPAWTAPRRLNSGPAWGKPLADIALAMTLRQNRVPTRMTRS
jgi:glycosyltransferase involved in cell wall biosynthesis